MKRSKLRVLVSFLLVISAIFSLCACGNKDGSEIKNEKTEIIPVEAKTDTIQGWISTEIETPEWMPNMEFIRDADTKGDSVYILQETTGNVAVYDSVNDSWDKIELNKELLDGKYLMSISVAADSLWISLTEDRPDSQMYGQLLYVNMLSGEQKCADIKVAGGLSTEAVGTAELAPLLALDNDAAMLICNETAYIVDANGEVVSKTPMSASTGGCIRMNDRPFLRTQDGLRELLYDGSSVSLAGSINLPENAWASYNSNAGHMLYEDREVVYSFNPENQQKEKMFDWLDTALSLANKSPMCGFENSEGSFVNFSSPMTIIKPGQVPKKDKLVMAVFRDGTSGDYASGYYGYSATTDLLDGIIRFNNSDPEYKIELKPVTFSGESERTKVLMELATGSGVDLIDTSILPARAVGSEMLQDMLPFLDEDKDLSRESFIPSLFNAMLRDGGLYEYTTRYTLLTLITHDEFYTTKEDWTAEGICRLIAENPDMYAIQHNMNKQYQTRQFALAATAEFIDRENNCCSFDSPVFASWLELLKQLPDTQEWEGSRPEVFDICYDYASSAGWVCSNSMDGDYVAAGFPGAKGTGSYFVSLNAGKNTGYGLTLGSNTRVGIMASSEKKDGAWRFVKTLMQNPGFYGISGGIPILKDAFEREVEAERCDKIIDERFNYPVFSEKDAEMFKEQVYNTDKICSSDEVLLDTVITEINAFLGGKGTAEEAASQIQSRVSLYLSEQG